MPLLTLRIEVAHGSEGGVTRGPVESYHDGYELEALVMQAYGAHFEPQFREDLERFYGLQDVRVELRERRTGSVVLFVTVAFATVIGSYVGISRYKNFVESVTLMAKHAQWLFKKCLEMRDAARARHLRVQADVTNVQGEEVFDERAGWASSPERLVDLHFHFLRMGFRRISWLLAVQSSLVILVLLLLVLKLVFWST